MESKLKAHLIYPAFLYSAPPKGRAVGFVRLTKTQFIIEKAEVIEGPVLFHGPKRFSAKTLAPIPRAWGRGWQIERIERVYE